MKRLLPEKINRQTGEFLNRYDFDYAGRDTVNQVGNIAPKIITKATSDINQLNNANIKKLFLTNQKVKSLVNMPS